MAIHFPNINPFIISFGPVGISWYSLGYIGGILFYSYYAKKLISQYNIPVLKSQIEEFFIWAIFGIVIGGRMGYVLIYNFDYYYAYPIEILKTFKGGMSFHGGIIGVLITTILFCKKYKIQFFHFTDLICVCAPIGIFFVRCANFINAELYGHVTYLPWGVIFPFESLPRHPSQLYEAILEGLVLFAIMVFLVKKHNFIEKKGYLSASFLMLYGLFRCFCELFREPDEQVGYIFTHFTMGQLLSIPLIIGSCIIFYYHRSCQLNHK